MAFIASNECEIIMIINKFIMKIDSGLHSMSHKELELLVVTFQNSGDFVTNVYERYLIYEAYKRYVENEEPYNLKWVELSLKLSFPKVQSIVNNLIINGYLIKKKSPKDRRVIYLKPTKKLIRGLELFETMKMNELVKQKIKINKVDGMPCLSDLSLKTKNDIKEKHLKE